MAYKVTLTKRAIKALEKINEPHYSNIKQAIYTFLLLIISRVVKLNALADVFGNNKPNQVVSMQTTFIRSV
jgi:mRNA-degrading endonuclease RelE of RelBE toxin-antitoxin system